MKHFDEHAHIRYAKWLSLYQVEKPYTILSQGVVKHNNLCNTNLETESTTLQRVEDVRKYHQGQFALDSHGFQFTRHEFKVDNWYDGNDVEGQYLPAVERVLRQVIPNVAEIRIFDWRLRKSQPYADSQIQSYDLNDKTSYLLPATMAHIDSTPASARHRVKNVLGDKADVVLKSRVRLINIWKPINHTVQDCPLAVCDGTTAAEADLLATDHVTRDHVGEMYSLLSNPEHKWYYMSQQSVEDVLLFKTYDSDPGTGAKHCPHAAFRHQAVPEGTQPRESIEVRALIFSNASS
ncbi:hypothetical protein QQX98_011684 [Neonectria punicea]|uniref:Methyltransferase n=1 Tax=Neonectria punicea TaxID=979145 RepID=A0ABR1GL59_9HYPO